MKSQLKSLDSIPFLICLLLLLLNDFHLKNEYHNWFTGKLSDFCGLFIFPFFWTSIFPKRKIVVYFLTALLFTFWKSPYSQTFIDSFSDNVYSIDRVIDLSDLIALSVLPISFLSDIQKQKRWTAVNPSILAIITLMSFCATSMPHFSQRFEQPQYILLKENDLKFPNTEYGNEFAIHRIDNLFVIEIKSIQIARRPTLDDEFQKTLILKDLDLRVIRESAFETEQNLNDYQNIRNSLTVVGVSRITIKHSDYTDSLNFKGSRLHGHFERFSGNERKIIIGQFKEGVEDSLWHFYNKDGQHLKKFFKNGELISLETFQDSKLIKTENINTRNETIRNKYFHIAILAILAMGLVTMIVRNYRSSGSNKFPISNFWKILNSLMLPLIVVIFTKMISSIIPNSFSPFFLGIIGEIFFIFIITVPLFLLVFYGLKLRKNIDLLWYVLLFSIGVIIVEEILLLNTNLENVI